MDVIWDDEYYEDLVTIEAICARFSDEEIQMLGLTE